MTRDGTLSANGQQKGSAMKNWRYIGLHAVAAAKTRIRPARRADRR